MTSKEKVLKLLHKNKSILNIIDKILFALKIFINSIKHMQIRVVPHQFFLLTLPNIILLDPHYRILIRLLSTSNYDIRFKNNQKRNSAKNVPYIYNCIYKI